MIDWTDTLTRVRAFVRSRVSNTTQADDITSMTMLAMIEALPRYQERGFPITAWAYRIARTKIVDYYRHERVRACASIDDGVAVSSDPFAGVLASDALSAMLPRERAAHVLSWAGYDNQEIAALWGSTEGAVKSLRHRSRARLS